MTRTAALAVLLILVAGVATAYVRLKDHLQPESVAQVGQPLPDIALQDLHGRQADILQFQGRPLLVVFLQVDCGHCQDQLAVLDELDRHIAEVQILLVSTDPSDLAASYFRDHPVRHPVLLTSQQEFWKKLGGRHVPAHFHLDADGILRWKAEGYLSPQQYEDALTAVVSTNHWVNGPGSTPWNPT